MHIHEFAPGVEIATWMVMRHNGHVWAGWRVQYAGDDQGKAQATYSRIGKRLRQGTVRLVHNGLVTNTRTTLFRDPNSPTPGAINVGKVHPRGKV